MALNTYAQTNRANTGLPKMLVSRMRNVLGSTVTEPSVPATQSNGHWYAISPDQANMCVGPDQESVENGDAPVFLNAAEHDWIIANGYQPIG